MSLEIKPLKTNKSKIKRTALMKSHTIPSFAESVLFVGCSGSGKTTLLIRLLTSKQFYHNYFNFVFLFSVTAKLDDTFKLLKVPDHHTFTTEDEMIEGLEKILKTQKEIVENKGLDKAPKIALVFEDLTSNKKLMKDPNFLLLWTAGRHLNLQVFACVHKYKAVPRTQRLQAMNVIYFRGAKSEVDQLADDFTPPGHTKKEFIKLVEYATEPDKKSGHNFLYMANKLPFKIRFRKNFNMILQLNK